jgi:outer membrane protein
MKFCIKILLIVISITFYSNAYSNNLAYVNIEFLLENSDLGKSISQNLIKMESEKNKFLKTEEEKLIILENEIKKIKNVISEDELNKKISIFKNSVNSYNKEKKKILNELQDKKNLELINFFDKISPILQEYMDQNSISLLFEKKNIFIGKSNIDITNDVLSIINKELK